MKRRGFTLVELLTVIGILAMLMAVALPGLQQLVKAERAGVGESLIRRMLRLAQVYAVRDIHLTDDLVPDDLLPGIQSADIYGDGYSGAAVLVESDLTVAIIKNVDGEVDAWGRYLERGSAELDSTTWRRPVLNAYRPCSDVEIQRLPSAVAIYGINRGGRLLRAMEPPFALRFTPYGQLSVAESVYVATDVPGRWRAVPCVLAVWICEADTVRYDASGDPTPWLRDNAIAIMFNRYTGEAIRH